MTMHTVERAITRTGAWLPRIALLTAVTLAGLTVAAAPAAGAGETLAVVLSQTDGTAPWNADDLAGHDSGPTNGIVRTNDNITYRVQVSSNGGSADSATVKLVLPRGVQFDALPPYCGSGSTLTPNPMPAPTLPVTATSYQSLPIQTLSCVVGTLPSGSTQAWDLVARVRPEVPHGTTLAGITASVTSVAVTTPVVSNLVGDLVVSAAAAFDLSKNSTALTENTGYYYADYRPCVKSTGSCLYVRFPMVISAPLGGKGSTPLTSPITFTDDLSPAALFGAAVLTDPQYVAAGTAAAATYGGSLLSCSAYNWSQPNSAIGGANTAVNSVRNSGTTTCTQTGGAGTPVSVSISNADTSAYTYPTLAGAPAGFALPGDKAYVYSMFLFAEIPTKSAVDLGVAAGSNFTLPFTNTYTSFTATDISGHPNTPEPTTNNYRTGTLSVSTSGFTNKFFAGVPGAVGNTPPTVFMPGDSYAEGPEGSTGPESGIGELYAGGTTVSLLTFNNRSSSGNSVTFFGCDSWDNSLLQLTNVTAPAGAGPLQAIPVAAQPVWLSGYSNTTIIATSLAAATPYFSNYAVQYGTGPGGAGTKSTCADADSPAGWFDSPAAVPGNDATLAAQGIYTAVSRVRVNLTLGGQWGQARATVSIGLRAVNGLASGTILPNWFTSKVLLAQSTTMAQSLASPQAVTQSTYNPTNNTGNPGDRLLVATSTARLRKEVWNPATQAWTSTTVPQYVGGQTVDFRLSPTLTSGVTAAITRDVVIEDCLPAGQNYVSASVTPVMVQPITAGMPAGAGLTCTAGQTYVKWDLGQVPVNGEIMPVTYSVRLSPTLGAGTYTNVAMVTAEDDLSPANLRTVQASVQVVQPMGVILDKVALTPVVEVNRTGEANPDPLVWRIVLVNNQATNPVPKNVDLIDILPKNGLNGTSYTGTLQFGMAAIFDGSTATQPVGTLLTSAPTVNPDPNDPSNGPLGIPWCTIYGDLVSGVGSCPLQKSNVTAVRIFRSGDFTSGTRLVVELTMVPSGNAAGDVYVNQVTGRVGGLTLPVGPVNAAETVIASSIGNLVWRDTNGNGIQDAGEPGVPNFPVSLSGTDSDNNTVTLSTTTDASGTYTFGGLQSGTYTVTFNPSGLVAPAIAPSIFSPQDAGTDDKLDSDGHPTTGVTAPIALGAGQVITHVDQGIVPVGIALSKQVCTTGSGCDVAVDSQWSEAVRVVPGDLVQWRITVTNTGGAALTNLVVSDPLVPACDKTLATLAALTAQSWTCAATTLVDVAPNTATVTADSPAGPLTASDPASVTVYTGSMGDTVWYDVDGDGVQDTGEPGIAGVTVTATTTDPTTGAPRTFTVITDAAGQWLLTGLPPGTYTVTLSNVDPDFFVTYDLDGVASPSTTAVTLVDGQPRLDVDFGYTVVFSVGDFVWLDVNGDGVYEPGDVPVPDQTAVELWSAAGTKVAQTITLSGVYLFTGLPAGDYRVIIPATALTGPLAGAGPAPHAVSDPNTDADQTVDHNALPGSAGAITTNPVTVSATLSGTPSAQITGNEPGGFTNATVDLALLGAPAVSIAKEICDPGLGSCLATAPVGTGGWAETYTVPVAGSVTWRITVTNTGLQDLSSVRVTDTLVADCNKTLVGSLAVGATSSFTCVSDTVLVSFTNTAAVTGTGPTGATATDDDDAAVTTTPEPAIGLVKKTNGTDNNTGTGPYVPVGQPVTWTYEVTNTGTAALLEVTVTDDQVAASAIDCGGGTNVIAVLVPGESVTCTATGVATIGQYRNTGSVIGTPAVPLLGPDVDPTDPATWPADPQLYGPISGPAGDDVTATDPDAYFGAKPGLALAKQVCTLASGCAADADAGWGSATAIAKGGSATFRLVVANTGNVTLAPVQIADPNATSCTTLVPSLAPGESTTVTCTVTAVPAAFVNVATATAQYGGAALTAEAQATVTVLTPLADTGASVSAGHLVLLALLCGAGVGLVAVGTRREGVSM